MTPCGTVHLIRPPPTVVLDCVSTSGRPRSSETKTTTPERTDVISHVIAHLGPRQLIFLPSLAKVDTKGDLWVTGSIQTAYYL